MPNMNDLVTWLAAHGACPGGLEWLHLQPDPQTAWDTCPDPYWMRQYLYLVLPPGTPDPTDPAHERHMARISAASQRCFSSRKSAREWADRMGWSKQALARLGQLEDAANAECDAASAASLAQYAADIRAAVPVVPLPSM